MSARKNKRKANSQTLDLNLRYVKTGGLGNPSSGTGPHKMDFSLNDNSFYIALI